MDSNDARDVIRQLCDMLEGYADPEHMQADELIERGRALIGDGIDADEARVRAELAEMAGRSDGPQSADHDADEARVCAEYAEMNGASR